MLTMSITLVAPNVPPPNVQHFFEELRCCTLGASSVVKMLSQFIFERIVRVRSDSDLHITAIFDDYLLDQLSVELSRTRVPQLHY